MDLSTIIADAGVLVPNAFTDAQKVRWLNQIRRMLQRKVKFPNAIDRQYLTADVALYTLPSDCQPDRIARIVVVDSSNEEQVYDLVTGEETLRDYVATMATDTQLWLYPTPTISGGTVSGISVDDGGSAFTSAPTVTVSGGGGSGCTATATINSAGEVDEITVTAAGTGYTTAPTVSFSGGGGSGATATASIYTDSLWLYYTPSETDWVSTNLTVEPSTPEDYHQIYVFRLAEYIAKARQDVTLANNCKADADEVLAQMKKEFDSDGVTAWQMDMNW